MSIAIFTHNFPAGINDRQNAGVFVLELAQELDKLLPIQVVAPGDKTEIELIGNVRVNRFCWSQKKKLGQLKPWNPKDLLRLLMYLYEGFSCSKRASLNDLRPNFILAMWTFPSGLFAYLLKKQLGLPYAVWTLGSDIYVYSKLPILGFIIKTVLTNADLVFADGFDLANKVHDLTKRDCIFIPSASVMKSGNVRPIRKKINPQTTFTFIGRIEKIKGTDILLEACKLVKQQTSKFKVNIIGDGSMLHQLTEDAKNFDLDKNVQFYGNINNPKKIFEILSGSDWLVIPSRSDSIPLVFSEGMKTRTPVIVADLPDLEYLVKKYRVGITFKQDSEQDLAQVMLDAVINNTSPAFQKNTIKTANLFDIAHSAKQVVSLLKNYRK